MQPSLENDLVRVEYSCGVWTIRWPRSGAVVRNLALDASPVGTARNVTVRDALGETPALEAASARDGFSFTTRARLVPGQSSVLFSVIACNDTGAPLVLPDMALSSDAVDLGRYAEPAVYVDSGSQGGTHVAPLGDGRTCAGICALHNPAADLGLVCAFVSFEHDNKVRVAPRDGTLSLRAATTTPVELAPGDEHAFDPVLLDVRRSPLEGLEEYASVVRALVGPPIPDEMPMGWLSWYAYRLEMTEELVLRNAEVMARHFLKYGMDLIHPDHGWQYKDVCGHWVPNEKFGHGMEWLQRELARMGMKLALWVAPSTISQWAPFFEEHPEGLITGDDGQPRASTREWTWPPHGWIYQLDPLTPAGEQFLRGFGKQMCSYGVVYLKADFIGGWGGARRLRHGMKVMREALGHDITLRPCSTALNTQLGVCNEIGIARDIGNAGGHWETMRAVTLELGSKWFTHGKFWHSNPDVLIVGDKGETLGEAVGRVTLLALTGGVVMLGDRMPELERQPERLALCSRAVPSSGLPARPLDLFRINGADRTYPRLWHLHANRPWGEWEVLGVFNWSDQRLTETISRGDLSLPPGQYLVWDFWAQELVGTLGDGLTAEVAPGTARCLRIMPVPNRPAVLSTDMHVTQGLVELDRIEWDGGERELSGEAIRAPEEDGVAFVYVPEPFRLAADNEAAMVGPNVARLPVRFSDARETWSARFERLPPGGQSTSLSWESCLLSPGFRGHG